LDYVGHNNQSSPVVRRYECEIQGTQGNMFIGVDNVTLHRLT